jgi:hypothetical protein
MSRLLDRLLRRLGPPPPPPHRHFSRAWNDRAERCAQASHACAPRYRELGSGTR